MAHRLNRIFLGLPLSAALAAPVAWSQDEQEVLDDIITPDIERRTIKEGAIDTEDFEAGLFAGVINIEDFGSNDIVGIRLAYHVSEDFFLELSAAQTQLQETSFERLTGDIQLLTDDQRDLTYYNLSVGYRFLPGEVFIGKNFAMNTSFYLVGGIGNTNFAEEEHFTYNMGAGFNAMPTDWLNFRFDVRGHVFEHDLFGETVETTNLETTFGITIFF